MNKADLRRAIKLIERAQKIVEDEIAEASGNERNELQNIDDRMDDILNDIEYAMM